MSEFSQHFPFPFPMPGDVPRRDSGICRRGLSLLMEYERGLESLGVEQVEEVMVPMLTAC